MKFFQTSSRNLLAAEAAAGVRHHVALSIVGADRLPDSGYLRAKVAQENLIKESEHAVLDPAVDAVLRVRRPYRRRRERRQHGSCPAAALIQPILFRTMSLPFCADLALGAPVNGTVEVGGPERLPVRGVRHPCAQRQERQTQGSSATRTPATSARS